MVYPCIFQYAGQDCLSGCACSLGSECLLGHIKWNIWGNVKALFQSNIMFPFVKHVPYSALTVNKYKEYYVQWRWYMKKKAIELMTYFKDIKERTITFAWLCFWYLQTKAVNGKSYLHIQKAITQHAGSLPVQTTTLLVMPLYMYPTFVLSRIL